MESSTLDNILARLRVALESEDFVEAVSIIETLHPIEQADLFAELPDAQQISLLPVLNPSDSADILERLEDADAAELVAGLPTEMLIRIMDEMEPDEAADLLGDMAPVQAESVLAGLEDADPIVPLLLHPDDSAGGLMTPEFLALRPRMTVTEALEALRAWAPQTDAVHVLFVVDASRKLVGSIRLMRLITADPLAPIHSLMTVDPVAAPVGADQEACADLMQRYDLLALPVTNAEGVLLGVVTIDDVVDVLIQEATEDIQRLGGAEPLERSYLSTRVGIVTRKRISWLLLLFLTESLTGTVLRYFETELEQAVALTFFVPLLIGTGGNAGSQTTSTIIRALAVGDIDLGDAGKALWHELRVGLLLGVGMAVVAYVRALTWGSSAGLAATVSVAILSIVIWANVLGSILPLLATRLRIDPTVVSGPVMSTLVDATGLFIYFSVARVIMGL